MAGEERDEGEGWGEGETERGASVEALTCPWSEMGREGEDEEANDDEKEDEDEDDEGCSNEEEEAEGRDENPKGQLKGADKGPEFTDSGSVLCAAA